MRCRLDGKVALVTGAARGLGRAYALALARAGAAVVVNDLETAPHHPAASGPGGVVGEIRAAGGHAVGIVESVADADAVRRMFQETVAAFGRVDIVVNNAGIVRSRRIVEMDDGDFDAVVAVHLRGTFLCTREAMRRMLSAGHRGRVINVTSGQAYAAPSAGSANYAAAKGGIISFTRAVAVEGAPAGITCNAVSPLARTQMSAEYLAGDENPQLDPDAVAPLVVFLASDAAGTISGEVFRIARGELSLVRTTVGPPLRSTAGGWTADDIALRIGELLPQTQ